MYRIPMQIGNCSMSFQLNLNFFKLYLLILERVGEGWREGERHGFVLPLTDAFIGCSCLCPDRGWNPQSWHIRTTLEPAVLPSCYLLSCYLVLHVMWASLKRASYMSVQEVLAFSLLPWILKDIFLSHFNLPKIESASCSHCQSGGSDDLVVWKTILWT